MVLSVPISVPEQNLFELFFQFFNYLKKKIQFNDFIIYDGKFMKALKATCCLNENIDDIEKYCLLKKTVKNKQPSMHSLLLVVVPFLVTLYNNCTLLIIC